MRDPFRLQPAVGLTEQLPGSFVELDVKRSIKLTSTQHSSMTDLKIKACAFITGLIAIIAINLVVTQPWLTLHNLEQATAQQCANHDWPVSAHDIHMDWCADNGYSTN